MISDSVHGARASMRISPDAGFGNEKRPTLWFFSCKERMRQKFALTPYLPVAGQRAYGGADGGAGQDGHRDTVAGAHPALWNSLCDQPPDSLHHQLLLDAQTEALLAGTRNWVWGLRQACQRLGCQLVLSTRRAQRVDVTIIRTCSGTASPCASSLTRQIRLL